MGLVHGHNQKESERKKKRVRNHLIANREKENCRYVERLQPQSLVLLNHK